MGSLLPTTRREQRLAQAAKEQSAPLVEGAKDAGQESGGTHAAGPGRCRGDQGSGGRGPHHAAGRGASADGPN